MGVTIEGDKEVIQQLTSAAETLVKALPGAMLRSVSIVEDTAKARAPVQTGALRDSITSDAEGTATHVTVEIGPRVDYADDVEFGGLRRAANPFMRSAGDETEDQVIDALVAELNRALGDL